MSDTKVRQLTVKMDKKGRIKLPPAMAMESGLDNGTLATVFYGKNYNCVIIIPSSIKELHPDMEKRIEILVTDKLGK